ADVRRAVRERVGEHGRLRARRELEGRVAGMRRRGDDEPPARERLGVERRLVRDAARAVREHDERPATGKYVRVAQRVALRVPGVRDRRVPDLRVKRPGVLGRLRRLREVGDHEADLVRAPVEIWRGGVSRAREGDREEGSERPGPASDGREVHGATAITGALFAATGSGRRASNGASGSGLTAPERPPYRWAGSAARRFSMSNASSTVRLERDGEIATVVLDRPAK